MCIQCQLADRRKIVAFRPSLVEFLILCLQLGLTDLQLMQELSQVFYRHVCDVSMWSALSLFPLLGYFYDSR